MEATVSVREEDGKTQLSVSMTADEVKGHIDAAFKAFNKSRIPGFRPGKAPRKVIEQNFGGHEAVYQQITADMVNDVASLAVDQEDVIFTGSPEFEELGMVKDGQPFTFVMFGDAKPMLELCSYDPVQIKLPSAEAPDEAIDMQIAQLQEYYYSFDTIEDRPAQMGDFVMASIESTANGEKVEGLNSSERLIELGGELMPPAFYEHVVGMNVDETREFDFDAGDSPEYEYLDGEQVHSKVTISSIRVKKMPELDDDFAKQVGFDTMEELRSTIKEQLEESLSSQLDDLKERRCIEELATRVQGEIPESYVNYTRQTILRDFFSSLQDQGMTFDQFLMQNGIDSDAFRKDLDDQAKENAEQGLALDALFTNLGLELTEEDIDAEFAAAEDPQAVRKSWEDAGRMSEVREAIRRSKAATWLMDNAVVAEDDGSKEDADGSEEDAEDSKEDAEGSEQAAEGSKDTQE